MIVEADVLSREFLSLDRHMSEFCEDIAGDRVEITVFGEVEFEPLVDFVDMNLALSFCRMIVDLPDSVNEIGVVFVNDFSDDLFEDVFHGDEARYTAVFVKNNDHVSSITLKFLE